MKDMQIGLLKLWNLMSNIYSGKDIDVLILTHNRKNFLVHTIESLLRQDVSGLRITIIDNASDDGTDEIVECYAKFGIHYSRSEINLGWEGNFKRAQQISSREWTIMFHDDDLLHPEYLSWVLSKVNEYPEVSLLGSSMTFELDPVPIWEKITRDAKCHYAKTVRDLAGLLYDGFPLCFPSVVYRTQGLKKMEWRSELYGKVADRPLLLDMMEIGPAVITEYPFVKYRSHSGQDSSASDSGPFVNQIANLHAMYSQILGQNPFDKYGQTFLLNNFPQLRDDYKNISYGEKEKIHSFTLFWEFVQKKGGASFLSRYLFGHLKISARRFQVRKHIKFWLIFFIVK